MQSEQKHWQNLSDLQGNKPFLPREFFLLSGWTTLSVLKNNTSTLFCTAMNHTNAQGTPGGLARF